MISSKSINYIGGVMVSMFEYSSGTLDCGFEPKTMKLVFAASLLSTNIKEKVHILAGSDS